MHRRFVLAALLAGVALLIAAESAQAQISFGFGRGGGYGRGGSSYFVDTPYFSYGRGAYSPWYGGYGYGRGYGPGYGWGSGYYPSRSGVSFGIGSPEFYSYPSYGYSYPSSSYSYPVFQAGFRTPPSFVTGYGSRAMGVGYESGSSQLSENRALIQLTVPAPDAEVWFEGEKTQQTGFQRVFVSPELESGQRYKYHVKARWMENGREVTREKDVHVRAGLETPVAFGERPEELRTAGYRDGQPIERKDDASKRRSDTERGDASRARENESLRDLDRNRDPARPRDPGQPPDTSRPDAGRSTDPINKTNNNPPPPE